MKKILPVRKQMCQTCPFRKGGGTEYLAEYLSSECLQRSRICHSTGSNNAFHKRTGKAPLICRGSRDIQLNIMYGLGFLKSPTDEAWTHKQKEMGLI